MRGKTIGLRRRDGEKPRDEIREFREEQHPKKKGRNLELILKKMVMEKRGGTAFMPGAMARERRKKE